jgi:hypothetical protein
MLSLGAILRAAREEIPGLSCPFDFGSSLITGHVALFGFGNILGIDIPFEKEGFIPSPNWLKEKGETWYEGNTLNTAIGQGDVSVTPLQIGNFYSIITSSSNAVNLTDGMDGLATGCTLIVALTFAVMTFVAGNARLAAYLAVPFVPGGAELTVVCAALIGASSGSSGSTVTRLKCSWGTPGCSWGTPGVSCSG